MRATSLFSGAGGFELGMERAGIETVLQCEIDPVALSVLRRHWPNVPKVKDVREIHGMVDEPAKRDPTCGKSTGTTSSGGRAPRSRVPGGVDLIYGGFPCQDLSVAGSRGGLGGARSGLWFEFRRVVSELRPRWVVVENVPGLYSSNERRDFATIVEGLTQLGYGVAWRTLDAQFLLVHQRRRRVFFVATYDMGDGAGAERAAKVLSLCEGCGRNPKARRKTREGIAASLRSRSASSGVNLPGRGGEDDSNLIPFGADNVGYALRAEPSASGDKGDGGINTTLVASLPVMRALTSRNQRNDSETETLIPIQYPDHSARDKRRIGIGAPQGVSYTLDASYPQGVGGSFGVRRLTPRECERLMGWPDNWTRWRDDGSEIPDTHRYRLIGNGVVSTVAEYIGRRLVAVEGEHTHGT